MSGPAEMAARPERRVGRTVGRFLLTLLIFVLLGPLVGGIVTIFGIAIGLFATAPVGDIAAIAMAMIIYGLWAAYPLGVIPAALVGLVIAIRDLYGGTGWWFAFVVGTVAGLVFLYSAGEGREGIAVPVSFFAASLIATLACFGATRGLQPRPS